MADMLRELVVMNDVAKIMSDLNVDEQRRVIAWLEDYFDVYELDEPLYADDDEAEDDEELPTIIVVEEAPEEEDEALEEVEEETAPEPMTFAEYFERVAPKTGIQKAVTAAYWLETRRNNKAWTSFQANKLLKSIDVKLTSISGVLAIESKKETPMIEVLQKDGDSMQSRKSFHLTDAGIAYVEARI